MVKAIFYISMDKPPLSSLATKIRQLLCLKVKYTFYKWTELSIRWGLGVSFKTSRVAKHICTATLLSIIVPGNGQAAVDCPRSSTVARSSPSTSIFQLTLLCANFIFSQDSSEGLLADYRPRT